MNLRDGYSAILEAIAAVWVVPEKLTVSEWADKNRWLSSKASSEPGQWRTARNSLLQEPMDSLSDHHPCRQVTCMFASQLGKSEIQNNWIGYTIDHAPAPMLVVEPDMGTMERYSKQRIEPMIDMSPELRAKVPHARQRDSGNTIYLKEFPGGLLVLGGANSSASLASMPIKKLSLDEIDKYPPSLGPEGSTLKQAEQRTVTFPRSKQLNVSTPVRMPLDDDDEGGSAIWRKYQAGSRARYHVPCPHCQAQQPLLFEHLKWRKSKSADGRTVHHPETAHYVCQTCGAEIQEHHKPQMLLARKYGGLADWVHQRPWVTEHLSYWASALYTPIGLGRSWAAIAVEWLEACRDRQKLVTFFNLVLGLPFDDHADRIHGDELFRQAEDYPLRVVPKGYQVLTAGVDVQDDHLDFLVRAWGRYERSVVIDRVKIHLDPEGDDAWRELTRLRHQTFVNTCGVPLRVSLTAIDTGGSHTQRVYAYCRAMKGDAVIAIKGSSQRKQPILGRPAKKDTRNARGDAAKHGVVLWPVGTDTAKEAMFARLGDWADTENPADRMVRLSKQLGMDAFLELTAEVYNPTTHLFEKIRARNEFLDLMVYSHAAACHPHVRVDRLTASDWAALERMLEPQTSDLFVAAMVADTSVLAAPVAAAPSTTVLESSGPAPAAESPQTEAPTAAAAPAEESAAGGGDWLPGSDWLH
jgi:phage terminase large subunit GpA-like protein